VTIPKWVIALTVSAAVLTGLLLIAVHLSSTLHTVPGTPTAPAAPAASATPYVLTPAQIDDMDRQMSAGIACDEAGGHFNRETRECT
jgi:hypothetical protein